MNTLYSQFLVEISSINCVYGETPKQDKDDVILTAKNCTTIAVEHMGLFAEYAYSLDCTTLENGIWDNGIEKFTTQQLIEQYFSTLK